jgi:hypothetical protein
MSGYENYNINLNVKYDHQELISVPRIVKQNKEKWFNQTLTLVNESDVRTGIIEGDFHWPKHEGVTISKGLLHRRRAPRKVVMLMVETANIVPTGDEE